MANTSLSVIKEQTVDAVEQRIAKMQQEGGIHLPPNYSPQNALRSAWLILQETVDKDQCPVLEVCSRESVVNALFDTVIQGLSPAKKQVYYIPYGKRLSATRSYHGTIAVMKRLSGVKDVVARVIFEGDDFVYEINNGNMRIVKHEQKIENIDNEIRAAYCIVTYNDEREPFVEIVTRKQIDMAWTKTKMRSNSVQRDFPEEMAKRTVVNRTSKRFINTSDDSDLVIEAFNRTEQSGFEEVAALEIEENANSILIDADIIMRSDAVTTGADEVTHQAAKTSPDSAPAPANDPDADTDEKFPWDDDDAPPVKNGQQTLGGYKATF